MAPAPSLGRGLFLLALLFTFHSLARLDAQDPGANPGGAAPGAPGGSPFGTFQNAPINSILDAYQQLSGKQIIRDSNLGAPGLTLSINAPGVSKEEMMRLIEANLLLNGVAILPVDGDKLKAITVATNKNPRSEGVKLYANTADLPLEEQIVSYYMPLNYITPQEAASIFTAHAPPHNYGQYVPLQTAQAIAVTENVSVIRSLIALKELMDVPPARVTSEFIQLRRADADTVATLLVKMLTPAPAAGAPAAPGGAAAVPPTVGNDKPMSNESHLLSGTAQILSDPRSNRLLVITRPVNMPFLRELIDQLDQPDIFMAPNRRPLRYVLAQDILPAIEMALAQGKDEVTQAQADQKSAASRSGARGQQAGGGGGGGAANFSSGGSSGSAGAQVTSPLSAPTQNNAPNVVTVGKTRLMADNNSNSIIVFGSPDVVEHVFSMIDELDRKPLQVYLATVIGQLTVSEGTEFGIDILQKFQKVGQGGLASSVVTPGTSGFVTASSSSTSTSGVVPEPRSLTSSLGFPLPTGLTLYGAIGSTLDAYLRALESTNRFKIISRPSVYTTNNQLAVIASGSQIPVPGTTTSGFTGGSNTLATTSNINYESVLLELEIVPLINAQHEVTLKIRQTNNSVGASQVISGNSVPTILTQEINTAMTVHDRQTIVIGGLISDTLKRTTSGVPLLSDIPGLGYLFRDTSKSKERDELIIMIQPNVVETDAEQYAQNEIEKSRTILGTEAEVAASATIPAKKSKVSPELAPSKSGEIGVQVPQGPQVPTHEQQPIVTVKQTTTTTTVKKKANSSSPSATDPSGPIGKGVKAQPLEPPLPPTTP